MLGQITTVSLIAIGSIALAVGAMFGGVWLGGIAVLHSLRKRDFRYSQRTVNHNEPWRIVATHVADAVLAFVALVSLVTLVVAAVNLSFVPGLGAAAVLVFLGAFASEWFSTKHLGGRIY